MATVRLGVFKHVRGTRRRQCDNSVCKRNRRRVVTVFAIGAVQEILRYYNSRRATSGRRRRRYLIMQPRRIIIIFRLNGAVYPVADGRIPPPANIPRSFVNTATVVDGIVQITG